MSSELETGTAASSSAPTLDGGGRPLRVGLTGNIGSGKSSVARLLAEFGAVVIDADVLAREATKDPGVLARVEAELGPGLVSGGALDRAATARRVFNDQRALGILNAIVHPWVARRRLELEAEAAARRPMPAVIVNDVPLLYEAGLAAAMDVVVVVSAPFEVRAERLRGRSGLGRDEALARDRAQLPLEEKAARADYVIDNAGTSAALRRQVERLWAQLKARSPVSRDPGSAQA